MDDSLLQFAREVAREVCIRTGAFVPQDAEERTWAREGRVPLYALDSVRAATERK